MRRGRMGRRVTHLRPASGRGLQGGFGMGRVEVPPHPPATRGSRVLQDRVWGSRVLQLFLWYRHGGSQGLLSWIRGVRGLQGGHGMGRAEVPPHPSAIRGSRVLQGGVWGSRLLRLFLWCRHRGSQRLLPWVRGVRDRARVRDRVVLLPPRRGAAPPPPSVGGQGGRRSAAVRHGGAGQRVGRTVRGAPRNAGMRQPVCRPAGGGS